MSLLLLFGGSFSASVIASTTTGLSGIMVVGSTVYSALCESRAATTARTCRASIRWYDSGGVFISDSSGIPASNSTSAWTELRVTDTSPASAVYAAVLVEVSGTAAAEVHYFDKIGFYLRATQPDWDPGD